MKLFSTLAACLFCASVFATGVLNDIPQAGVLTFTAATGLKQTNSFPVAYSHVPFVTVKSSSTNSTPFTLSAITSSNFVLTVTADSTTNNAITWNSSPGTLRMQQGTVTLTAGALSTNSFAAAFSATPVVSLGVTSGTNVSATVSSTRIILLSVPGQTVSYTAVGYTLNPGDNVLTY
jgi:hypothetical protein